MKPQYISTRKLLVIIVAVAILLAIVVSSESILRVQAQNDVPAPSGINLQTAESDPSKTIADLAVVDYQPGTRPEVLITLKTPDGYKLEGVELEIFRKTDDLPIEVKRIITDSNGQAVFDLSEEKAQALDEAIRSGTGRSDLNYIVFGHAVHQDAEGVWYFDIITTDFYKVYFDKELYIRKQIKDFRRDRIKQGLGAALPSDEAKHISEIVEDVSVLEGQEKVILEISTISLEIGNVGEVVLLPNGLETIPENREGFERDPMPDPYTTVCYADREWPYNASVVDVDAKIGEIRTIPGTINPYIKVDWIGRQSFDTEIKGFLEVTTIKPAASVVSGKFAGSIINHQSTTSSFSFTSVDRSLDIWANYRANRVNYKVRCQQWYWFPSQLPTPIPTSVPDSNPLFTHIWEVEYLTYQRFLGSMWTTPNTNPTAPYPYDDLVNPANNNVSPCWKKTNVQVGLQTQLEMSTARNLTYSGSLSASAPVGRLGFEYVHKSNLAYTWRYILRRPNVTDPEWYALYSLTGTPKMSVTGCATANNWEKIGVTYQGAPATCQIRNPEGFCVEPTVYPTIVMPVTPVPWPNPPTVTPTPTQTVTPPSGPPTCANVLEPRLQWDNERVWICNIEWIQFNGYRVRFRNDGINPDGGSAMWCQAPWPCELSKQNQIHLRAQTFGGPSFTQPYGNVTSFDWDPVTPEPPGPTRPAVPGGTGQMSCVEGCTGPVVSLDFNDYTSDNGSFVLLWDDPITFHQYNWNDPYWQVVYEVSENDSLIYRRLIGSGQPLGTGGATHPSCYVNGGWPVNATAHRCLRFEPGGSSNPATAGPRNQRGPGWYTYKARACWADSWNGSNYSACSEWSPGFIWPNHMKLTRVNVPGLPPTINSFSVSPTQVIIGSPVTVSWNTGGGTTHVRLIRHRTDNTGYQLFDNLPLTGTLTDTPPSVGTYIYKIEAMNASYVVVTQEVNLVVTNEAQPILNSFSVTPQQIYAGLPVTINWSSGGGTTNVSLLRNGTLINNNMPLTGSLTDTPTSIGTNTYRLIVSNNSGTMVWEERNVIVSLPPTGCVWDGDYDALYDPLKGEHRVLLTWDLSLNGACSPQPIGYNLWRGSDPKLDIAEVKLNKTLQSSPGSWEDFNLEPGQQIWYWIEIIYSDGTTSRMEALSNPIVIPDESKEVAEFQRPLSSIKRQNQSLPN